jgi:acyl-CoA synthetase (NDP forming)
MLEARSVAVVGASGRSGSFGEQLLSQLLRGGYQGAVHPVNPRYQEVLGLPCRPSLADLPGPVDLAVLAVPNHALEAALQAAADAAIPAAVIFASCAPQGLAERLRAIALAAGMVVCGGNGMGFFGGPPADLAAVADAVVRLSVLAVDLGDRLAALDANPLVAGPAGCLAVDALVVQAPISPED